MSDGPLTVKWTNEDKVLAIVGKTKSKYLKVAKKKIDFVTQTETVGDAQENVRGNFKTSNFKKFIVGKTKIVGSDKIVTGLQVDLNRVPYARIQEFGGEVTPKKAKFLTIPFPGIKGFARDFKNTFFKKSANGNLILFQNLGKTKTGRRRRTRGVVDIKTRKGFTIRPLFVLKKKVRIDKQPYMKPALVGNLPKYTMVMKQIEEKDFK